MTITIFPVLCTDDTVGLPESDAFTGDFTLLSEAPVCKRYTLESDEGSILFVPNGETDVSFRGLISFGPEAPPAGGAFPAPLRYDPNPADADNSTRPVPWCSVFVFEGGLVALGTQLPPGDDTWCIADVDITGGGSSITATWQVYGEGDPRFSR